ncbi:ROK family protein [Spiroplasma floricola]|uniref:Glucokinase n=1 Tax=Spiroplasma floricola 23-6 TaxID=1336749 RepID=A0A2K8SG51_9MOLU|nr:ROK family protein [Spiroplasma floricola]AUB31800.1 glucokinase [Spiroplasma floricola 23-6]
MKLAIDIGGTSIRFALIDKNQIIKKEVMDTNPNDRKSNFDYIKKTVESWNETIDYIGICCPGPLDLKTGTILITYNLPDWSEKCILQEIKDLFKIDNVKIDNDGNIAALGQYIVRKNLHSLLYFTISTGIGAGFIYEGKIFQGYNGTALEIANSLPCWESENPQRSGIEFQASGKNICVQLNKLGVEVENAKQAFELYKTKKNETVNKFFAKIENQLISLFSTSINFLNPEMIVIGGSVAIKNQEFITEIMKKVWQVTKDANYKVKFEFAKDLEDATLLGCCEM